MIDSRLEGSKSPVIQQDPSGVVIAALVAILGPWVVGMSIAFTQPGDRWSVEGGGAVLIGVFYLAAFGALAGWIAGNYQIALGALAGEAFALGSLSRHGGLVGVVFSVGAGVIGGFLVRQATTGGLPPGQDPRPPIADTRSMLIGMALALAIPVGLISYGNYAAGGIVSAMLFICVLVWALSRRPAPWTTRVVLASLLALLSLLGIAWAGSASARESARIAARPTPLDQVLGLRRADGMTFGDFVRARFARQVGCASIEITPSYSLSGQGPVHQRNGDLVFFNEVFFDGGTLGGCPSTSTFYVAVFADNVPPRVRGEILVRDCVTLRKMGRFFPRGETCPEPISEIRPGFRNGGEIPAVDWLTDFRSGEQP